jgi:transcriptional regulator with XRE-family HTH domain
MNAPNPLTPGEKVRAARIALGWTQQDLAVASRTHTSTIQKIEQGDRGLSGEMALRMAQSLGCSPRWLRPDLPWEVVENTSVPRTDQSVPGDATGA